MDAIEIARLRFEMKRTEQRGYWKGFNHGHKRGLEDGEERKYKGKKREYLRDWD